MKNVDAIELENKLHDVEDEITSYEEDHTTAKALAKFVQDEKLTDVIKKEHKEFLYYPNYIYSCNSIEVLESFEKNKIDSYAKFLSVYFVENLTLDEDIQKQLERRYFYVAQFITEWQECITEAMGLEYLLEEQKNAFNVHQAADYYLSDLNEEYPEVSFEEVEKHSGNYPAILKSDHPDAFKNKIVVFSYMNSDEDIVVKYVDLEDCEHAGDVRFSINHAIDFENLNEY